MRKGLRSAAASLLLAALPCAAQEPAPRSGELRTLEERARDELHPAEDPLVIVGREQAGNDLRARTPALARSDRVAVAIDPEAAYERALALYADGATFHAPPAAPERPSRASDGRERRTAESAEPKPVPADHAPWWRSSLPAFLVGALVLLYFYRRRGGAA